MPATATAPAHSLDRAMQFHSEGRAAEAEAAYRAVLAADPEQPIVPPLLGMLLLQGGRAEDALPLLKRAVSLSPDDPETHLAYANALYRAGRSEEAIAHYRNLLIRWPDKAAAWSNLAEALRAGGRNESALQAADRALAILPNLAEAHLGRGNALLALGRDTEAEAAYAGALAADPDLAPAYVSRAAVLLRLGKAGDAAAAARRGVTLAPRLAEAQFTLGCALKALGERDDAIDAFETAIQLDPSHARAWLNLGNVLSDADRFHPAEAAYRAALSCDPNMAEAHSSLGCLLSARGQTGAALIEFERAIALRPDYAEAHWNQGFTLLLAGDFARGWEKYEWRKRHDRFAQTFPSLKGPAWEGEKLAGRTLLIYAEQGLGDTLQFVRYATPLAAAGAKIVFACDPKLIPLLQSMPDVAAVVAKDGPLPDYDFWVDQMSLPRILGTGPDSIPTQGAYLKADPAKVAAWRATLPPGRTVGIVWAGNPGHSNDARRSMQIETLRPLLATANTNFVSLQVGDCAVEAAKLGPNFQDLSHRLTDFAATAALIANLDLVITVDTAVAHLAGALGTPVWVMLPHAPDWRWLLDRADTPWYRTMRLFRQPAPGDWGAVVEQVAQAL